MTLIAFATYGDHAEFITDDISYTVSGSEFGRCTKHMPITHLDAVVLTQGSQEFGDTATNVALRVSHHSDDFDAATGWLNRAYSSVSSVSDPGDTTVVLLGYSPRHSRFVAYAYASDHEFRLEPIDTAWVMPTPFTLKPSDIELERMQRSPHITDRAKAEMTGLWAQRPMLPVPAGIDEWVYLARVVRQERALESFHKVLVGGHVVHTRIDRGSLQTRRVHTFDDTGEEFNQLVAGTHHPQAQLAACHCGSGERFIDCHLAPHLDEPCGCGSDIVLRDCCSVIRTAPTAASVA